MNCLKFFAGVCDNDMKCDICGFDLEPSNTECKKEDYMIFNMPVVFEADELNYIKRELRNAS
jgi:hypothetical protein